MNRKKPYEYVSFLMSNPNTYLPTSMLLNFIISNQAQQMYCYTVNCVTVDRVDLFGTIL